jgi:hypothetical protein
MPEPCITMVESSFNGGKLVSVELTKEPVSRLDKMNGKDDPPAPTPVQIDFRRGK